MVKLIVQAFEGKVHLESTVGQGTSVKISIPLVLAEDAELSDTPLLKMGELAAT